MENVLIIGSRSIVSQEIVKVFQEVSENIIMSQSTMCDNAASKSVKTLHLDLRDNNSINSFVQNINQMMPIIDIAIFLSGILPGKNLQTYQFDEIDEVMAINFNGQAKLISKLFPYFSQNARLLLFSSISAQRGSFDTIYAGSKGALLSLVKSLSTALPPGARVNAIAPGLIKDSGMFLAMDFERQEHHRRQIPSRNLLDAKDLAKIVFDLCQEHWSHLNGACIDLNGGQNVR